MSRKISLKEAERRVFVMNFSDGLWDIFLGSYFLMFAVAPLLSEHLGDFWSSAVFLPFWGLVFLMIWLVRRYIVSPRLGLVTFGKQRKNRLMRFNLFMLVVNTIALVLGMLAALNFARLPGQIISIALGPIFLIGFSTAAYFLDFSRLYVYGLLVGVAPPIGEWMFQNMGATHHGFPITFGFLSALMVVIGLTIFGLFLRNNPMLHSGDLDDGRNAT